MSDQETYYQERQEVHLVIEWMDATEVTRHATCEEAWMHERKRKHTEANRRSKADRSYPVRSYYYGRTITDKTYGGVITSSYSCVVDAERLQDAQKRTARLALA
jgi:hypothetical protein